MVMSVWLSAVEIELSDLVPEGVTSGCLVVVVPTCGAGAAADNGSEHFLKCKELLECQNCLLLRAIWCAMLYYLYIKNVNVKK